MTKRDKIQHLCEDFGYENPFEMVEDFIADSICPCICMNEDCDYICELEPDCDSGYCENCRTQSCKSLMILCDVI